MRKLSDLAFVHRILNGDAQAGEQLVTDHYERIYRFLRHVSGCEEGASDLTQQTFVRAWQSLAHFRGESSVRTWLHSIAYREYLHWRECQQRTTDSIENVRELPDPRSQSEFDAVLVRRAIVDLTCEQREAFVLYYVNGLSVHEVSLILDVPSGTVKSRLFAARKRLRALLGEQEEGLDASMLKTQSKCETV